MVGGQGQRTNSELTNGRLFRLFNGMKGGIIFKKGTGFSYGQKDSEFLPLNYDKMCSVGIWLKGKMQSIKQKHLRCGLQQLHLMTEISDMSIFKESIPNRIISYTKRIRDLREASELTQDQVAKILHVGQRTYSDYENEIIRIPVDALITLAEFYDADMNYICGLTDKKAPFPR